MLHYDLSEFRTPVDERTGCYLTVRAWDDDGFEVSIITDKYGCGLFEFIETSGDYKQVLGTSQYSLPGSESGVRARLKRKYDEMKEELENDRARADFMDDVEEIYDPYYDIDPAVADRDYKIAEEEWAFRNHVAYDDCE